jgi:ubiquinone/menaquinone biosynthesis C-methylase UbiE
MSDRRGVRETYDRIAAHFSQTREYAWPEVREFVEEARPTAVPPGSDRGGTALDLGCGNGRHAAVLAERSDRVVGADLSRPLLAIARRRAVERGYSDALALVQADATALPLADDAVALATYVATIHHLPSRRARVASLDELARVLAPGGHALVSAWSVTHSKFDAASGFDTTVDWTLPDGETVARFYHVYDPDEFERDIRSSALDAERIYESEGNCYARVRKGNAHT